MQQIYSRTPMQKCDFNKVTKQLYWSHTSAWMFSCKFAAYFRTPFPENTSGSCFWTYRLVECCLLIFFFFLTIRVVRWGMLGWDSSPLFLVRKYIFRVSNKSSEQISVQSYKITQSVLWMLFWMCSKLTIKTSE